jgi:hypothetical protein
MANAAQAPKLQLGKLSPEDAERLASSFRPIWDLDDAPFAQGSALSAADIDALAGGAGVSPSIRGTQHTQVVSSAAPAAMDAKTDITIPRPSVPGHVPAVDAPKVEIAVELDTADLVTATPAPVVPAVAQARSQSAPPAAAATMRKPYTPPSAPPQSINMRDADASSDLAPVKKSNTGIIIGAAAVVAIIGAIVVVKAMSGDKTQSDAKTSTSQTNHEEGTHIPPPPEVAATQEATAAPTQTAAPVVTAKATNDSPIVKEFPGSNTTAPPPATTHATTAAIHQPLHSGGGTTHAGGGGGKPPGKPAIVRDNPF